MASMTIVIPAAAAVGSSICSVSENAVTVSQDPAFSSSSSVRMPRSSARLGARLRVSAMVAAPRPHGVKPFPFVVRAADNGDNGGGVLDSAKDKASKAAQNVKSGAIQAKNLILGTAGDDMNKAQDKAGEAGSSGKEAECSGDSDVAQNAGKEGLQSKPEGKVFGDVKSNCEDAAEKGEGFINDVMGRAQNALPAKSGVDEASKNLKQ